MDYPLLNGQNITFFTENDNVDLFTLSLISGTAAANHPVTELQNESVKLTFKTTTAGTTTIRGNAPFPYPNTTNLNGQRVGIGFINHNFGVNTILSIRLYDTALVLQTSQSYSAVNYSNINQRAKIVIDEIRPYKTRICYVNAPTPFTLGRWEIDIADPTPSVAFWEFGRLFLTPVFQPKDNFNWEGLGTFTVDESRVTYSDGKDSSTDFDPRSRGLNISPPMVIKTNPVVDIPEWGRLIYLTGKRFQILCDPYPKYPDADFILSDGDSIEAYHNATGQIYGTLETPCSIVRSADGGINSAKINGNMTLIESLG